MTIKHIKASADILEIWKLSGNPGFLVTGSGVYALVYKTNIATGMHTVY